MSPVLNNTARRASPEWQIRYSQGTPWLSALSIPIPGVTFEEVTCFLNLSLFSSNFYCNLLRELNVLTGSSGDILK